MPHAFAVIALLFILQAELWVFATHPEELSVQAYGGLYVSSGLLAHELSNILEPSETLYVLGDEPGFYFITKRRPAPGVFFLTALTGGPLAQELTTRVVNDLERKPPDLVVILGEAIGDETIGPDQPKLGQSIPCESGFHRIIVRLPLAPRFSRCALDRVARLSSGPPTGSYLLN